MEEDLPASGQESEQRQDEVCSENPANSRNNGSTERSSRNAKVPPIRSLRIRQPAQYSSRAEPQLLDEGQASWHPQQRRPASIVGIIQRLEELLHEAVQVANVVAEQDDYHTTLKTGVDNESREKGRSVDSHSPAALVSGSEQGSAPDSLQPCAVAHRQSAPNKASPSPAALSKTFKLRPMIPRRRHRREAANAAEPSVSPLSGNDAGEQDNRVEGYDVSLKARSPVGDKNGYVKLHHRPPVGPRTSSARMLGVAKISPMAPPPTIKLDNVELNQESHYDEDKEDNVIGKKTLGTDPRPRPGYERGFTQFSGTNSQQRSPGFSTVPSRTTTKIDLKDTRYVDLYDSTENFEVHESHQHAPAARNWPNSRKHFAATIACINTACTGILIGIYAGEVPAIQYVIVDFHHYTILGNVFLYCGLVIPVLFAWPLPLLHGRKPYILCSLAVAICLQIPQGVAVSQFRSPYVSTYRKLLLLSRAVSGFALGFTNINQHGTLLDLFGASLQSRDGKDDVSTYDVRRHGGGIGLWLSVWSSCTMGSVSLGFLTGTLFVNNNNVSWGFWTCLILLTIVLLLNVISPEVRRSAFRRTIAEMWSESGRFSRVTRGEVKMHLDGVGPFWWGEEVKAGLRMSWLMIKQPGFLILSVYAAWVYAQFTMVLMVSFPRLFEQWLSDRISFWEHYLRYITTFGLRR